MADPLLTRARRGYILEGQMAWLDRLHRAQAEIAQRYADPFRPSVEAAMRGKEAISSAALLDLLDLQRTTSNARRVGKVMRSLGFIAIKSRKLNPGGFRDTVARGWARPVRETREGQKAKTAHTPNTGANMKYNLEPKEGFFAILQEGIDEFYVGYIYPWKHRSDGPKFSVREGGNNEVAVVKSIDDAIPALAGHYHEHPPWWHRGLTSCL